MENEEVKQEEIDKKIEKYKELEQQAKFLKDFYKTHNTVNHTRNELEAKCESYYKGLDDLFKDKTDPVYKIMDIRRQLFNEKKKEYENGGAIDIDLIAELGQVMNLKEVEKNVLGKEIENEIKPLKETDRIKEFKDTFNKSLEMNMGKEEKDVDNISTYFDKISGDVQAYKLDNELYQDSNRTVEKNMRKRNSVVRIIKRGVNMLKKDTRKKIKEENIKKRAEKIMSTVISRIETKVAEGKKIADGKEQEQTRTQEIINGVDKNDKMRNKILPVHKKKDESYVAKNLTSKTKTSILEK